MTVSGGASVARSELLAAAVVAAQASEEVCGARGYAAAALGGAKALLLHTRLPRLPVLAGRCVFCCGLMRSKALCHQTYTLSRTVLGLLKRASPAILDSLVCPSSKISTRLCAHESTQQSSELSGSCMLIARRKKRTSAPRGVHHHPSTHPSRHTPPPRGIWTNNLHTRGLGEVHPREPLLPGQINEALARERPRQQRRPRLVQFEPHASAIPPQDQGRPV